MTLIDTSSWIPALRRRGNEQTRIRVRQLVANGEAAWCAIVRLELWSNVGDEGERKALHHFEEQLPDLTITNEIWQEACQLAARCRKVGKTAPASDFLIAACARSYGTALDAEDAHFEFLMRL